MDTPVDVPAAAAAAAEVVYVAMAASVVNMATRTVVAATSIAQAATVGSTPVAVVVECLSKGTIVPKRRMAEVTLVALSVVAELTFALAASAAAATPLFFVPPRSEPGDSEVLSESCTSEPSANCFAAGKASLLCAGCRGEGVA